MKTDNPNMSFYQSIFDKIEGDKIALHQLVELIQTGTNTKETIDTIRACTNKSEKDSLKKKLSAVTISGVFSGGHQEANLTEYSGIIQVDIDQVEKPDELKKMLVEDVFSTVVFVSPSGTGVKVLVKVEGGVEKHKLNFSLLKKYYAEVYNLKIDEKCKDVSRLMYLSYDPFIHFNQEAGLFSDGAYHRVKLERLIKLFSGENNFNPGERNDFVFRLACSCRENQLPQTLVQDRLCTDFSQNDFPVSEIMQAVRSAYRYKNDKVKTAFTNFEKSRGSELSKLQIIENYIKTRYELRRNTVANKIEYRLIGSNDCFKDLNENNLYRELEHNRMEVPMNKLIALINSEFVEEYNPIQYYFEQLPEWNENTDVDYIDLLTTYVPVKDEPRFKKQFKKALVRIVACALDDRVFNKQALIFVHEKQNSGKSTFCRWLCPEQLSEYIIENIGTDKDSQIALFTNFIINMDELASLTRENLNALKSFMSKDKVNVRLPFGHRNVIRPRRASFVGSTNKMEFLNDETGSVRWLCFELIDQFKFSYKEDISIDDVWRQAFSLYNNGFEYRLTQEEILENESTNRKHHMTTAEMELIELEFSPGSKDDYHEFFTATEIGEHLSKKYTSFKSVASAIGKALSTLEFKKLSRHNPKTNKSHYGYYLKLNQ